MASFVFLMIGTCLTSCKLFAENQVSKIYGFDSIYMIKSKVFALKCINFKNLKINALYYRVKK